MYLVNLCFPGCLNENSEDDPVSSLREARAIAAEMARDFRDSGYHVTGNCRTGYKIKNDKQSYGGMLLYISEVEV